MANRMKEHTIMTRYSFMNLIIFNFYLSLIVLVVHVQWWKVSEHLCQAVTGQQQTQKYLSQYYHNQACIIYELPVAQSIGRCLICGTQLPNWEGDEYNSSQVDVESAELDNAPVFSLSAPHSL
jgi:hypothetical protein